MAEGRNKTSVFQCERGSINANASDKQISVNPNEGTQSGITDLTITDFKYPRPTAQLFEL